VVTAAHTFAVLLPMLLPSCCRAAAVLLPCCCRAEKRKKVEEGEKTAAEDKNDNEYTKRRLRLDLRRLISAAEEY